MVGDSGLGCPGCPRSLCVVQVQELYPVANSIISVVFFPLFSNTDEIALSPEQMEA